MAVICLDTNVLIEITKNNTNTIKQLHEIELPLCISSISVMELLCGARNKQEATTLNEFVNQFKILTINDNASLLATTLVRKYAKSHHLDIPDALIAASCIENNVMLWTYNIKDFHYLPKLQLMEEENRGM